MNTSRPVTKDRAATTSRSSSGTKILDISGGTRGRRESPGAFDEFDDDRPQKRHASEKQRAEAVRAKEPVKRQRVDRHTIDRMDRSYQHEGIQVPKKLKGKLEVARHVLAVEPMPSVRQISKLDKDKNKSILGDSVEEIHQLLERSANESAISLTQRKLLQVVLDAIPMAENTIRETNGMRGVYQLNSLITSVRELMIDMQATQDKAAIAEMLIEKILRPIWLDIAMLLVQEDAQVTNVITANCSPEQALRINKARSESMRTISGSLQRKYEDAKEQTRAHLSN